NLHCPSRAAFRSIVACTGRRSFEGFAHYVGAERGQTIEGRARAVLTVRSRPPQRRMERRGPVARVSPAGGSPRYVAAGHSPPLGRPLRVGARLAALPAFRPSPHAAGRLSVAVKAHARSREGPRRRCRGPRRAAGQPRCDDLPVLPSRGVPPPSDTKRVGVPTLRAGTAAPA